MPKRLMEATPETSVRAEAEMIADLPWMRTQS